MNSELSRFRSAGIVLGSALRQAFSRLGFHSPFVLVVIILTIAFPVFFLDRTVIPVTSHGVMADGPYGYSGTRPADYYTRDPLGSMGGDVLYETITRNAFMNGKIPFWNPYQGLGYAFSADTSSKVFYPPNLLRLILPVAYWDFINLAHVAIFGVFVFLFASTCGLTRIPAVFAGASAFAIGHFQVYLGASSILQTEAWLPALFYIIERSLQVRQLRFGPVLAALFTYGLATGGHPGPAMFGLLAIGIYVFVRLIQQPGQWRGLAAMMPAFVLGGLLAAPTWLSFFDSIRLDTMVTENRYDLKYHFLDLLTFVVPYLTGGINSRLQFTDNGWGMGFIPPILSFLAIAALIRPPHTRILPQLIALAIASTIVAGWGFSLPGLSILRSIPFIGRLNPNYLWVIPAIMICLAAGLGLSNMLAADRKWWQRVLLAWLVTLSVAGALIALMFNGFGSINLAAVPQATLQRGLFTAIAWAALIPVAIWLAWLMIPAQRYALACQTLVLAGIALSAVNYFPSGTVGGAVLASKLALCAFLVITLVVIILDRWTSLRYRPQLGLALATAPAAIVWSVVVATMPGLPNRYDPLKRAPYLEWINERTKDESGRVTGISGMLFPNFASAFEISSINILGTSMPIWGSHYAQTAIDSEHNPVQFWNLIFPTPLDYAAPIRQMLLNRRHWDNLAVRYLIMQGGSANYESRPLRWTVLEETETAERRRAISSETVDCRSGSFDRLSLPNADLGKRVSALWAIEAVSDDNSIIARSSGHEAAANDNDQLVISFDRVLCSTGTDRPFKLRMVSSLPTSPVRAETIPFDYTKFRRREAPPGFADEIKENRGIVPVEFRKPIMLEAACPAARDFALVMRLSTYVRSNPGKLTVRYRDSSGKLAVTETETAKLKDNSLFLSPLVEGLCRNVTDHLSVTIAFQPSQEGSMIAYWESATHRLPFVFLLAKVDNGLQSAYFDPATGVEIWENTRAQPRLYVARQWKQVDDWQSAQNAHKNDTDLRETAYVEENTGASCAQETGTSGSSKISRTNIGYNEVSAHVETSGSGILTIVDLWQKGWSATVNGRPEKVLRVNGIFRGLCLPSKGSYDVIFRYEPPLFRLGLMISGFGAFGLLGYGLIYGRRRRVTA